MMDFFETPVAKPSSKTTKPKERRNMKGLDTSKKTVSTKVADTKVIAKNLAEFVDAACLAIVSGFAIYQAHFGKLGLSKIWADVLLFAGFVIALQAFVLLVKHFNHPSK